MDRGAWQAMVHRLTKSQTWLKQLSKQAAFLEQNYLDFVFKPTCYQISGNLHSQRVHNLNLKKKLIPRKAPPLRAPSLEQVIFFHLTMVTYLEKEMATHSSILAWKIPWTKEPGRLLFMGLQRVGHDWATLLAYGNLQRELWKKPRLRKLHQGKKLHHLGDPDPLTPISKQGRKNDALFIFLLLPLLCRRIIFLEFLCHRFWLEEQDFYFCF